MAPLPSAALDFLLICEVAVDLERQRQREGLLREIGEVDVLV